MVLFKGDNIVLIHSMEQSIKAKTKAHIFLTNCPLLYSILHLMLKILNPESLHASSPSTLWVWHLCKVSHDSKLPVGVLFNDNWDCLLSPVDGYNLVYVIISLKFNLSNFFSQFEYIHIYLINTSFYIKLLVIV